MTEPTERVTTEQAVAMTMPTHRIEWTIDHLMGPRATFHCEGEPGAQCRLECAEACGDETWPCGPQDARHDMVDAGYCVALLFLTESDEPPAEMYHQDAPAAPLVSGPIELVWDGDTYWWRYPEPEPQPAGHPDHPHGRPEEWRDDGKCIWKSCRVWRSDSPTPGRQPRREGEPRLYYALGEPTPEQRDAMVATGLAAAEHHGVDPERVEVCFMRGAVHARLLDLQSRQT